MIAVDAEQVVREMYGAFRAKDAARLRGLMAPDIQWNQCPGFPGGNNRRGVDDVLAGILGTNQSLWTGFVVEIREYLTAGDTVVVLGAYSGAHSATGKPMHAEFAHVYRVADGRIIRFDQVTDTWPMVQAMQR